MRKLFTLMTLLIAAIGINSLKAQIAWPQNGSNIYYNGGNVGIGTTGPACKLHIIDASNYQTSTGLSLGSLTVANNYAGIGSNIVLFENQNAAADNQIAFFTPAQYVSGIQAQRYTNGLASSLTLNPLGGNVGIGTTTPQTKFEVSGAIRIHPTAFSSSYLHFMGNGTNIGILGSDAAIFGGASNNLGLYVYGNNNLEFSTNNARRLIINGSGNIGIGTANPQGSLQINSARPILFNSNGSNGVYGSEIGFNAVLNTNAVPNQFKKLGGTNQQGGAVIVVDHWGSMYFQTYNANTENESTINYNPQITFSNTGNVGIGTTTPQALVKLDVRQSATNGNAIAGYVYNGDGTLTTATVGVGYATSGSGKTIGIEGNSQGSRATGTNIGGYFWASGAANNYALITGNGNVGIGTTNPQYKLTVEGTIAAREVKVTAETWSDFVFHPTYKLRSLGEVEQFIKVNSHLPEIPTTAEVKENGVSLGEMNAKLLQKVEELTLYLIEQNKKMDQQQAINEKQNQLIKMLEQKIEKITTKK